MPSVASKKDQIVHPYDRYIVYAIFYYVGNQWKDALSSYYEALCNNEKIPPAPNNTECCTDKQYPTSDGCKPCKPGYVNTQNKCCATKPVKSKKGNNSINK